jgi:acetyl esterase/lipase
MIKFNRVYAALVTASLGASFHPALAQSSMAADAPPPKPMASATMTPKPMASATMAPKPSTDMQAVLSAQTALGAKPIEMLTPAQARMQPTPADGVKVVMQARQMSTAPDPSVVTSDMAYGSDPMQKARIYRPAGNEVSSLPVVVYFHGGGWVIADLDVYDATPRFMAQQLGAIVVSVEYRKAPEAKFPAQHDDAMKAYRWVLANAASWHGDVKHMALAGESAGGNLAVATTIAARDAGLTMPKHILAVYPIANTSNTLPSRTENFDAKPLNTPMLGWFSYYYSRSKADAKDPRINLVAADLHGLPPVTIVNAQIDPLRSDGETLAVALRTAKVAVEQRSFPGVTHEFFGMGKVVRGAADAESYAVGRLRPALMR